MGLKRAITFTLLVASVAAAETKPEIRALVKSSLDGLAKEDEQRSQWLYTIRGDRTEFDSNGKPRSQRTWHWRRIELDGHVFGRTIERDGRPLSDEERKQEEESIRQQLAGLKSAPPAPASVQKRQTKPEDAWIREFPEALDYEKSGEEMVDGRKTVVLKATPRPGYKASNLRARVFEKMNGTLWIDAAEGELARVDAEMFDTVNVGFGVIGRIEKGTRFQLRRQRVDTGVWLASEQVIRFAARFLLVKTLHQQVRNFYADFERRPSRLAAALR
jgi:hypothetical protein